MKVARLATLLTVTLLLGACACEKTASATSAGMINTKCPISGEDLDGKGPTVDYHGKTIGFCCNNCVKKFNAMDDATKEAKVSGVK